MLFQRSIQPLGPICKEKNILCHGTSHLIDDKITQHHCRGQNDKHTDKNYDIKTKSPVPGDSVKISKTNDNFLILKLCHPGF